MIAAWMIYSVAVTFLLYVAAIGGEHVIRALRAPTRFAWLLAMIAAVALSGRAMVHRNDASRPTPAKPSGPRPIPSASQASAVEHGTTLPSLPSAAIETSVARFKTVEHSLGGSVSRIDVRVLDRWNRVLIIAWALASALVSSWLLVSLVRLRRLARPLVPATVANHQVFVSDSVGPALLGIWRTRVVLPRWVVELPAADQEIIVAHERQHAVAFDPALVCASLCIVALEPWNAFLWMLLSRLRLAVEADCDRRVLGGAGNARAYGKLLVAMYERTSGLSPHVAFAERASNLERRIRRITSRPRLLSATVGGSAIAAVVCATTAWRTSVPTRTAPLLSPAAGASAMVASVLSAAPRRTPATTRSTAPLATETLTKPFAAEAGGEEPRVTVPSESRSAEAPWVTFRQIVIAASDSNDIPRAARLADSVASLLRQGVPFDTLAKRYLHEMGKEGTSITTPWPIDSLPPSYQKGLAGARLGDIVSFQIPGSPQRPRVPKFVVAQVLSIAELLLPAVRAETSLIHITIEAANEAAIRIVAPQDSTTSPIRFGGRMDYIWGTYRPSSMMEITSLDTTRQVHIEATQNGRVIASGEGTYLVLHRDSVGVRIEAWSHVPPSRSQVLPKPAGTARSDEQRGSAPTGPCAMPDSIAIRGLLRLRDADVRSVLGITPKTPINGAAVTQALKNLYATNSFESNATTTCEVIGGKSVLVFNLSERRTETSVRDSISARLVELELQRVSSGSDWTLAFSSARRFDSEVAALHRRLRSLPDGVASDREATGRVVLALEARAASVRSWLDTVRLVYTDEYPTVRNAQAEDQAIGERLAAIRRGM